MWIKITKMMQLQGGKQVGNRGKTKTKQTSNNKSNNSERLMTENKKKKASWRLKKIYFFEVCRNHHESIDHTINWSLLSAFCDFFFGVLLLL